MSAFFLGLRHGVDWDHIAAITDLSATQDSTRRGMLLGLLYALGHGLVVLVIGTVTIVAGKNLPDGIDAVFGRIVGVTLILLGLYVGWSLWVHRDGFRMQSRWMLVIGGVRRLIRRVRSGSVIEHEHRHAGHADVHHRRDEVDPVESPRIPTSTPTCRTISPPTTGLAPQSRSGCCTGWVPKRRPRS